MTEAHRPSVIVVNDDLSQLRLASALLEKDGMDVTACAGAEEALQILCERGPVDVIVTDLHMPGIDGWRLCRMLRSADYGAFNGIPILVLSATFSGVDAEAITSDVGANAFLALPYKPSQLKTCVRDLLEGRRPRAAATVLIVDDSAATTKLLRAPFEARGYSVQVALTGEEARRLCESRLPQIAVIDYHLPDMKGDELLAELKRPGSHTAAIVISADPRPGLALECTKKGADGYVRKPLDPEYLISLCEKAQRERSLLRVEELLEERTQQLKDSEARFRLLFEGIPELVLVHDADGTIMHINDFGARLLEWPTENLLGKNLREILAPQCAAAIADCANKTLATGSCSFEATYVARTGRSILAEVNSHPIEFEGMQAILSVSRDVTERKRAEQALRDSERRFRFLVENAFDGISISELDPGTGKSCLVFCNDRFVEMSGYSREQLQNAEDLDELVVSHHSREHNERNRERVLKGLPVTGTASWKRPDGKRNAYEWTAVSLRMGGKCLLTRIDRDVTERQRVEEKVREALWRFEAVIENTPLMAIQSFDRDGVIHHWNTTCKHLYGYSAVDVIGRRRQDLLMSGPTAREFERAVQKVWNTGEAPPPREWPVHTRNGESRWVYSTMFPIFEQGKVVDAFCMEVDVTDRRRAERRQRALLRLHQNTLATIPSCLLVLDADLNVVMANQRLAQELCIDLSQAPGNNIEDVFPGAFLAEQSLLERIRTVAAQGGKDKLLGVRVAFGNQPERHLNVRIRGIRPEPEEAAEEETRVLLVIEDVTQERMLEEQVRQAGKMESIGKLAGGVAHDFNNLLTGISGYTKLVLEQVEKESDIDQDLTQILDLADRAARLTRHLLAFSRRQALEPVVLNINTLIESTSKMLSRLIGEDVELKFIPAPDLGNARVDQGQIEQVLMNLAVNAREAMPEGGKLTIETANVTLDEQYAESHLGVTPGPYVMLSVTDTGCGMDKETLEHAFEPFFTTKAPGVGTGLGLSTVYGIVKQHGGSIWIRSQPGRGSIFRVYMPQVDAEPQPDSAVQDEGRAPRGSETILLVEDEEHVRRIVERVLLGSGYNVLTAESAEKAEQVFAGDGRRVELLLTDVIMPGRNGPALYERLVQASPSLKVLYMSGYMDSAVVRQDVLAAGTAFLQKPFLPEVLLRKVREAIDGATQGER